MSITTCSKCGEKYDGFYIHTCEAEEKERREKEKKSWANKSAFGKFFGYPPDLPYPLKILSRLFVFGAVGGIALLLIGVQTVIDLLSGQELLAEHIRGRLFLFSLGLQLSVYAMVMSYGIAHTKKWALYITGTLLVLELLSIFITREFGVQIVGLLFAGVILWAYRAKFTHSTTKVDWVLLALVFIAFLLQVFVRLYGF